MDNLTKQDKLLQWLVRKLNHYLPFSGDRQIGRDSGSVELDAKTLTVDPDDLDDTDGNSFNCTWSCVDGVAPCRSVVDELIILPTNSSCVTAVQSRSFAAGKSYVIRYE